MKFKRKRASFSAPTPPAPPPTDDVVENDKPDKKEALETTEVSDSKPSPAPRSKTTSANAPTPPVKMVSRTQTKDSEATINKVLSGSDPKPEQPPQSESEPPEPARPSEPEPVIEESMSSTNQRSSSNFLLIMITIFALVLGLAGWLLYFNASGSLNLSFLPSGTPEVTPTPEPTTAPTPTPNPRVDVVLDVLNGSGVAGAAGATASQLEELGYQIATIGNAANQNFAESEVYTGENLTPDQEMLLLDDLTDLFGPATISGVLTDDSTASAQIIVGQDWQE